MIGAGALVDRLAEAVDDLLRHRPRVVVGIDGPDAAGKSTLADRLGARVGALRLRGDDFLRPRAERYRRGELSPEGYYRDPVDDEALLASLSEASSDVVVLDGIFLQRPVVRARLTLAVYLRISPEESLRRALIRDLAAVGAAAEVERRYRERYLPGQALYRAEVGPERLADVLVDNEDPVRPRILRWP
jgi:uridine kinase